MAYGEDTGDRTMQITSCFLYQAEIEGAGEPRSRHLGGPVRELRMHLEPDDWRVTYCESTQVDRALATQAECARSHGVGHDLYDRPLKPLEES